MLFPWYIKYPNQNDEILNLDWILKTIDNLVEEVSNFVNLNTIKYADPIQWNITTQYEKNTLVIDPISGSAYLSVQPVPSGVGLNNTDYWTIVFTLDVLSANKNITLRDDANNMLATFESAVDDWILWQGTLYVVTRAISIGQAYVEDYNIERATVEYFLKLYITNLTDYVNSLVGSLTDLTTTDKDNIVDAINELVTALNNVKNSIGTLQDLETTAKNNLVAAINEIVGICGTLSNLTTTNKSDIVRAINEVASYCGDLSDLTTTDKTSLVDAINEVDDNIADEVQARTNADNDLSGSIADEVRARAADTQYLLKLHQRKFLFVGDSYGDNPRVNTTWAEQCALALQLRTDQWDNLCASGAKFVGNSGVYLNQIENYDGDKNAITDIIILAGANDASYSFSDLIDAMRTFKTYATSNYPNATVNLGWIGFGINIMGVGAINAYEAYKSCGFAGIGYIPNMLCANHDYLSLEDHNFHPDATALNRIGWALATFISRGYYDSELYAGGSWLSGEDIVDPINGTISQDSFIHFNQDNVIINVKRALMLLTSGVNFSMDVSTLIGYIHPYKFRPKSNKFISNGSLAVSNDGGVTYQSINGYYEYIYDTNLGNTKLSFHPLETVNISNATVLVASFDIEYPLIMC